MFLKSQKKTENKRTQLRRAVSGNLSYALLYEINDMTAAAKSHTIVMVMVMAMVNLIHTTKKNIFSTSSKQVIDNPA